MNPRSFNVASLASSFVACGPSRVVFVFWFVLVCVLRCPSSGLAQTEKVRVPNDIEFTADVYSLKCGETTTLSWKAASTDQAFILGVGKVPIEGRMGLQPLRTTTYSLLAEGPVGLRAKSIKIKVERCQKGDDDYPDDEKYEAQITNSRAVSSVIDFLTHTQQVLQDRMGFIVKSFQSSEGFYIFKTKVWERRASTPEDNENRIGARRVSYFVEIRSGKQSGTIDYTIKTFTTKKKIIKETWTVENDPAIRRAEADKVREALDQP